MVILTQALGHPKRVGLVKSQRSPLGASREHETAQLDPPARTYLEQKRVWDIPLDEVWYVSNSF